nr:hypothetical protein CFP56_75707 [Quercus suber]
MHCQDPEGAAASSRPEKQRLSSRPRYLPPGTVTQKARPIADQTTHSFMSTITITAGPTGTATVNPPGPQKGDPAQIKISAFAQEWLASSPAQKPFSMEDLLGGRETDVERRHRILRVVNDPIIS